MNKNKHSTTTGGKEMEIKCTVEELKELIQRNTPVAVTTDVIKLDANKITSTLEKCQNSQATN